MKENKSSIGGPAMNEKYRFFEDPGHGWLEVTRKELIELGIANKVSSYSYQKGEMVYLEEDCDASLFADAKGWNQFPEDLIQLVHQSPRNYQSYKLEVA